METVRKAIIELQPHDQSGTLKSIFDQPAFDIFSLELLSSIKGCFEGLKVSPENDQREKALTRFHTLRLTKLGTIWKKLFDDLGLAVVSPMLQQGVNRRVFEVMVINHFTSTQAHKSSPSASTLRLGADEENIIRYMSGYVALKLKHKYEKKESAKAEQFVECLSSIAVQGQQSSFYEYTKEWMKLVDRGGLFQVNDNGYLFFRALELRTRQVLPQHLMHPSQSKDSLLQELKNDEDVQFLWCMVSVDISDSEDADQLLTDIIELWVTIRGFSVTGAWMDQYKKSSQKTVKKKKALRKIIKPTEPKESS